MIRAVLATADPALRVKLVTAKTGKTERATPVAHLFEAGKVLLHGRMAALERELLGMIAGEDYRPVWTGEAGEAGKSPDRADAMVWGVTELMLGKFRAEPSVRRL
jgi:phage terminase large subunit-like protein